MFIDRVSCRVHETMNFSRVEVIRAGRAQGQRGVARQFLREGVGGEKGVENNDFNRRLSRTFPFPPRVSSRSLLRVAYGASRPRATRSCSNPLP